MNKIGVFGGTFDPIHNGHLYIAENARVAFNLSEVIIIPSHKPPHKQNKAISKEHHRYNMCELAISDNDRFSVSDIEMNREDVSYTYNTLMTLKEDRPNSDFYFIMGADMFSDFPKWYKAKEIITDFKIIAFPREGYDIFEIIEVDFFNNYKENINLLELATVDISGTSIREQIKKGLSVKYIIPNKVIQYIDKNNLYRG
ncbi:MAG: nicotinate-nucleotide adenylyltransferase [Clostridia bacterium]